MRLILIIEPDLFDREKLRHRYAKYGIPLEIHDPLLAIRAAQMVKFDVVIDAREKEHDPLYAPFFGILRLVSPTTRLVACSSDGSEAELV